MVRTDVSSSELKDVSGKGNPKKVSNGSEEGFAQPKGIQTRAAIANHLAKKLKIEDSDPKAVF